MDFADLQIVRPLANTSHGPILLVTDADGQFRTLRFLSLPEFAQNQERLAQLQQQRFQKAVNIVGVFTQPHRAGVVCEYAEGQTLADLLLIPGAVKPNLANFIALRLQEALQELHEMGLFHGDLTPANIVISTHGQVKLIDFATVTGGTFGYREEGKPPSEETDLYAFRKICLEMGADVPVESAPLAKGNGAAENIENPVGAAESEWGAILSEETAVGTLSPAALLRADLARAQTVAAVPSQVSRGRHSRPRRKLGVYLQQTFNLRVTLGLTLLIVGASSFGYWFQGSAVENPAVQDVPALNVLKASDANSTQTQVGADLACMNQADAEAIVRSLLKQRNEALAQLDTAKLQNVYASGSDAGTADAALFKRLEAAGEVVNGLRSEISDLQVVSCADVVTLRLQHRLLEHERCNANNCQVVPVGPTRWEQISLVGPNWRIKEIKVGE
ncbi:MAG: protein kinase [Actinomycetaceae bacterium]|nr:protein kinase [Actinomycetaceae bacterium]